MTMLSAIAVSPLKSTAETFSDGGKEKQATAKPVSIPDHSDAKARPERPVAVAVAPQTDFTSGEPLKAASAFAGLTLPDENADEVEVSPTDYEKLEETLNKLREVASTPGTEFSNSISIVDLMYKLVKIGADTINVESPATPLQGLEMRILSSIYEITAVNRRLAQTVDQHY